MNTSPYIPGTRYLDPEPLSRYLPTIPQGVAATWLKGRVPLGAWVLDPFAASPRLAVESALAGYRVLVTANNPISRFLLEMCANPPKSEDLVLALASLSGSFRGTERLEPHILSLYNTICLRCGNVISASAFYWEEGSSAPYMRVYECPNCGDSGEHPVTPFDVEAARQFSLSGPHKARALERVVAATDQDRIHVEQALTVYIPRALYALITIINNVEGLNISPVAHRYLSALLLNSFDLSNAMWRVPSERERRRQLTIPPRFREINVWKALESSIAMWSASSRTLLEKPVPVSTWPEVPPVSGGICVYEGRLINIADSLAPLNMRAVVAAIPRPNQAFWTLSALWAGWLWGREVVGSFKSVLHRQRYDWGWHTSALTSVFKQLKSILDPNVSILGLISETEPGFIAAVLAAGQLGGCAFESIALREEIDQAQVEWNFNPQPADSKAGVSLVDIGATAAREFLSRWGEPGRYIQVNAASLVRIIQSSNYLTDISRLATGSTDQTPGVTETSPEFKEPNPLQAYSALYASARDSLSYRQGFLRFVLPDQSTMESQGREVQLPEAFEPGVLDKALQDGDDAVPEVNVMEGEPSTEKERGSRSSDIPETTYLWLRDTGLVATPSMTDRYEQFLVSFMIDHAEFGYEEIDSAFCVAFPGLLTPDPEFTRTCLASYAQTDPAIGLSWRLRDEDLPEHRADDMESAEHYLLQIGSKLGFEVLNQLTNSQCVGMTWRKTGSGEFYSFLISASAAITSLVAEEQPQAQTSYLVLPGSRANLILYKLRHDPRLARAFNSSNGNWRFIKFRLLRAVVENPQLNSENFDQLLSLDPLTYSASQMRLI